MILPTNMTFELLLFYRIFSGKSCSIVYKKIWFIMAVCNFLFVAVKIVLLIISYMKEQLPI